MRAAEIQGNLADRADSAISLPIEGMTCASCVARIERSLSKVEGVQSVSVNLTTERADIQASNSVDRKALVKAVEDAGYNVPSATGIELAVEGMTCASCVGRVERALKAVPGVTEATVNLATERASVRGTADVQALIAAIAGAGYTARPIETSVAGDEETAERKDAERRDLKQDFFMAAALALPVFLLEMGSHVIPGAHALIDRTIGIQTSWYIQFVLTTLVLAFPGIRFYEKGLPALARLAPDMNSLVSVGTLAATCWSLWIMLRGGEAEPGFGTGWAALARTDDALYLDVAAVVITFLLAGRYFEARAKRSAGSALSALLGWGAKDVFPFFRTTHIQDRAAFYHKQTL